MRNVYQCRNRRKFLTLFLSICILGCGVWGDLNLNLVFNDADGLKVKSPLIMQSVTIGEVTEIELNEQGKVIVKIKIKSDYKKRITVGTAFVLSHEGFLGAGNSYIEVITPKTPGEPLASNTIINGTTKTAYQLKHVGEALNNSIKKLTKITERLYNGLNAYGESP